MDLPLDMVSFPLFVFLYLPEYLRRHHLYTYRRAEFGCGQNNFSGDFTQATQVYHKMPVEEANHMQILHFFQFTSHNASGLRLLV